MLVVQVGDNGYGIALQVVREVVASPVITPLPTLGPPVVGLFNLRGEIVPAFEPAVLLEVPSDVADSVHPPFAVVVDTTEGPAALTVSRLPSVAQLGAVVATTDRPDSAVHQLGPGLVTVIDPAGLVERVAGVAGESAALSPPRFALES